MKLTAKESSDMQHREFPISKARTLAALLVLFGLGVFVLPPAVSSQQKSVGGRPRRVASAPQQKPSPTAPAQRPLPTPTPRPTPDYDNDEPPPPPPRLQTSPGATAAPSPTPTPEGQVVDEDETVTVDAQLVVHNVRVVDRYNRPIKDVRKEDFRVFDNGVLQNVEFFETREVPISYGIVVDNSGSLRSQINQVIDASKTIINSNREGDEAFVVQIGRAHV
jgi:Ca-activated chloride channel family protein